MTSLPPSNGTRSNSTSWSCSMSVNTTSSRLTAPETAATTPSERAASTTSVHVSNSLSAGTTMSV